MNEVIEICLSYPKLKERLDERPKDREKAIKNLKEIKADLSLDTISGFGTFIEYTFAKVYEGINVQVAPGLELKELIEKNNVILVPNHQSHADYIGLSYALWNKFKIAVHIAGGINLNIFPIGALFRKSGCFFIRRSFNNDILYKLTLESYIYFLLAKGFPIEFFFEGGRSRTGKLNPPRFGLFQMILETHHKIPNARPLVFLPVSIVHEVVPEQRSLTKELRGGKKEKESASQLLKIFKLFTRKLGTIHLTLDHPISVPEIEDLKLATQEIAFRCYRQVAKNMLVTPTSLVALILLDEPKGVITKQDILTKAQSILSYCEHVKVPLSPSLTSKQLEKTVTGALNLLLSNKKIEFIESDKLSESFFSIREDSRVDLLYFKNTILHHFMLPCFIFSTWIYIFTGQIKNEFDLKKFYLTQRKQMKYEFYLPTVKELYRLSLEIISYCLGRKIEELKEVFNLSNQEAYLIAKEVGSFSRSYCYIHEAYYIGALTIRNLGDEEFGMEKFLQRSKEIFIAERKHGKLVKYPESFSIPLIKNSLTYFESIKLVEKIQGKYTLKNESEVDNLIAVYANYLSKLLTFNL